ncbi:hypothetical protein [Nocardioides ultimimeridianus]
MGTDSRDVIGLDVDHLDSVGRTISGRGDHAGTTATRLASGLSALHGHIGGNPEVGTAMAAFLEEHIAHPARHLGKNVTAGGHGVSGVATTARSSDNEAAADLHIQVAANHDSASLLLRNINVTPREATP